MAARKPRRYQSPLRREQTARTTERLLDAVAEGIRAGDRELAYAAIARRAGVSVPTVYRHFPTLEALVKAFVARVEGQPGGAVELELDRLEEGIAPFFRRFEDPGDPLGEGRLNVVWQLSRLGTVPRRRAMMARLLDAECPGVPEPARTHLIDVAVVLLSSATGEAFRGYLDLTGDPVTARVALAVRALFTHARTLAPRRRR